MIHYVVDGYNLLYRLKIPKKTLAAKRDYVVSLLKSCHFPSIELVFDGQHRKEIEEERIYFKDMLVTFTSRGQTADQYILARISLHANETIVTSDKKLSALLVSEGFKVISCEEFILLLQRKVSKKKGLPSERQETQANIERLEKIFEERLLQKESEIDFF